MPGINGADVLIVIDVGVSTPSFVVAAGQRDVTFDESNNIIDISSKDTGRIEEVLVGRLSQNITLDMLFVDGDAGRAALQDASRNGTEISIRRRFQGGDIEQVTAFVETRSESFPDQDAGVVSLGFRLSGSWGPVSP